MSSILSTLPCWPLASQANILRVPGMLNQIQSSQPNRDACENTCEIDLMMSRSSSWFLHTFNENALQVLSSDGGATFDQPVMGLFHDANEWMAVFFHHFLVKFPLLLQETIKLNITPNVVHLLIPKHHPTNSCPYFLVLLKSCSVFLFFFFLLLLLFFFFFLLLFFHSACFGNHQRLRWKFEGAMHTNLRSGVMICCRKPSCLVPNVGTNLVDCIPEVNESLWSLTAASKREPWPWCHQHDFVMIFQ